VVELQKALEVVDIKLPGHEIRELVRKHDTNVKDGKLDMVEFGQVSEFFLYYSNANNGCICFMFLLIPLFSCTTCYRKIIPYIFLYGMLLLK